MSISSKICPHCGAELVEHNLFTECEFCGYVDSVNSSSIVTILETICYDINARYKRIPQDLERLQYSPCIKIIQKNNTYTFRSTPRYFPKNGYSLNKSLGLELECECNKDKMNVVAHVYGDFNTYTPTIVISSSDISIAKKIDVNEAGHGVINFELAEFFELCKSTEISIDTNFCTKKMDYEEVATYFKRFAHIVFFPNKYRYSIHQKLLID